MTQLKVAIAGAAGRMGKALLEAIHQDKAVQLVAAIQHAESSLLGCDVGELSGMGKCGVTLIADLSQAAPFDVLIDFTQPEATLHNVRFCVEHGRMVVVGTTGFDRAQLKQLMTYGQDIPMVIAPNMSIGVNLCFHVLREMAAALGDDADIEIIEAHHRNKLDAPSGTARHLGEILAQTLNRDLEQVAVYGREGITGVRDKQTIGFSTIRAGDVVGDHTVLFAGDGERIELTHKASSRMAFAKGAIRAARWLSAQPKGVYDMQDVLGFNHGAQ